MKKKVHFSRDVNFQNTRDTVKYITVPVHEVLSKSRTRTNKVMEHFLKSSIEVKTTRNSQIEENEKSKEETKQHLKNFKLSRGLNALNFLFRVNGIRWRASFMMILQKKYQKSPVLFIARVLKAVLNKRPKLRGFHHILAYSQQRALGNQKKSLACGLMMNILVMAHRKRVREGLEHLMQGGKSKGRYILLKVISTADSRLKYARHKAFYNLARGLKLNSVRTRGARLLLQQLLLLCNRNLHFALNNLERNKLETQRKVKPAKLKKSLEIYAKKALEERKKESDAHSKQNDHRYLLRCRVFDQIAINYANKSEKFKISKAKAMARLKLRTKKSNAFLDALRSLMKGIPVSHASSCYSILMNLKSNDDRFTLEEGFYDKVERSLGDVLEDLVRIKRKRILFDGLAAAPKKRPVIKSRRPKEEGGDSEEVVEMDANQQIGLIQIMKVLVVKIALNKKEAVHKLSGKENKEESKENEEEVDGERRVKEFKAPEVSRRVEAGVIKREGVYEEGIHGEKKRDGEDVHEDKGRDEEVVTKEKNLDGKEVNEKKESDKECATEKKESNGKEVHEKEGLGREDTLEEKRIGGEHTQGRKGSNGEEAHKENGEEAHKENREEAHKENGEEAQKENGEEAHKENGLEGIEENGLEGIEVLGKNEPPGEGAHEPNRKKTLEEKGSDEKDVHEGSGGEDSIEEKKTDEEDGLVEKRKDGESVDERGEIHKEGGKGQKAKERDEVPVEDGREEQRVSEGNETSEELHQKENGQEKENGLNDQMNASGNQKDLSKVSHVDSDSQRALNSDEIPTGFQRAQPKNEMEMSEFPKGGEPAESHGPFVDQSKACSSLPMIPQNIDLETNGQCQNNKGSFENQKPTSRKAQPISSDSPFPGAQNGSSEPAERESESIGEIKPNMDSLTQAVESSLVKEDDKEPSKKDSVIHAVQEEREVSLEDSQAENNSEIPEAEGNTFEANPRHQGFLSLSDAINHVHLRVIAQNLKNQTKSAKRKGFFQLLANFVSAKSVADLETRIKLFQEKEKAQNLEAANPNQFSTSEDPKALVALEELNQPGSGPSLQLSGAGETNLLSSSNEIQLIPSSNEAEERLQHDSDPASSTRAPRPPSETEKLLRVVNQIRAKKMFKAISRPFYRANQEPEELQKAIEKLGESSIDERKMLKAKAFKDMQMPNQPKQESQFSEANRIQEEINSNKREKGTNRRSIKSPEELNCLLGESGLEYSQVIEQKSLRAHFSLEKLKALNTASIKVEMAQNKLQRAFEKWRNFSLLVTEVKEVFIENTSYMISSQLNHTFHRIKSRKLKTGFEKIRSAWMIEKFRLYYNSLFKWKMSNVEAKYYVQSCTALKNGTEITYGLNLVTRKIEHSKLIAFHQMKEHGHRVLRSSMIHKHGMSKTAWLKAFLQRAEKQARNSKNKVITILKENAKTEEIEEWKQSYAYACIGGNVLQLMTRYINKKRASALKTWRKSTKMEEGIIEMNPRDSSVKGTTWKNRKETDLGLKLMKRTIQGLMAKRIGAAWRRMETPL